MYMCTSKNDRSFNNYLKFCTVFWHTGILTHSDPDAVIRLVNSLHENGHSFIIHVDGKESSTQVQRKLLTFAATRDYVHVLPDQFRARVNWGGFSMVNATLQILWGDQLFAFPGGVVLLLIPAKVLFFFFPSFTYRSMLCTAFFPNADGTPLRSIGHYHRHWSSINLFICRSRLIP